ncbi:glycosyltransferase family 39 protein, partial [bacterium]|nr:glycosyltransferase family 39 protein [bacterium]
MARKPQHTRQPAPKAAARTASAGPLMPEPVAGPDRRLALDALAIFAIAWVVRLLYVAWASGHDPFFGWSRPGFDMNVFQAMADMFRSGDWLMRRQGLFYFSPIYGYFCGIVYTILGGRSFLAVHLIQTAIGALAVALAFITARTFVGRTGGWVAGISLALAGPWLFYEQVLLHEGLMLFFYCVFFWGVRTGALGWRLKWARLVAAGIAIGLAAIGRGNALAALIVMAGWLLLDAGRRGPVREYKKWGWAQAGALALGTMIVLGSMVVRNHAVTGKWTLGMENGRVLFYLGNAVDADGTFMYSPRFTEAQTLARKNNDPSQYLKYFMKDVGDDPGHWLSLLGRKTYYFFRTQDLADNMSLHLGERYILPLRLTPVRWWWLTPLGLLGLGLACRRWRQWLPVWLFAGAFAGSLILIIPIGRYRAPILLPLAFGAGFAVEWAIANWRARRLEPVAWAGGALIVLGLMLAPWKPSAST